MQQEKWIVYAKKADFKALSNKYGIDQVTARIIVNRGIDEESFSDYLNPSLEKLYSPHLLLDLDKGVEIASDAVKNNKKNPDFW